MDILFYRRMWKQLGWTVCPRTSVSRCSLWSLLCINPGLIQKFSPPHLWWSPLCSNVETHYKDWPGMYFVANVSLVNFRIGPPKKFFCDVSGTKNIYKRKSLQYFTWDCADNDKFLFFFFLEEFMAIQLNSHQTTWNPPLFPNVLSWCL